MGKKEIKIRIDNYSKIKEAHDEIIKIINKNEMTSFNAIGLLELIKQEIFIQSDLSES